MYEHLNCYRTLTYGGAIVHCRSKMASDDNETKAIYTALIYSVLSINPATDELFRRKPYLRRAPRCWRQSRRCHGRR